MSMTMADRASREIPLNASNTNAAAALWSFASGAALIAANATSAAIATPIMNIALPRGADADFCCAVVSVVSGCAGSIMWFERTFLLKCHEFGQDCSIIGQLIHVRDSQVCEQINRGPVEVLACVFRISRSFKEAAGKEITQRR